MCQHKLWLRTGQPSIIAQLQYRGVQERIHSHLFLCQRKRCNLDQDGEGDDGEAIGVGKMDGAEATVKQL